MRDDQQLKIALFLATFDDSDAQHQQMTMKHKQLIYNCTLTTDTNWKALNS